MSKSIAFTIYSEENGTIKDSIKIRWDDLLKENTEVINVTIGKSLRCWKGTARQERMIRVSQSNYKCTYYHIIESYHQDTIQYSFADSNDKCELLIFDIQNKRLKRVMMKNNNIPNLLLNR